MEGKQKALLIFSQRFSFQDISGMLIETDTPVDHSNNECLLVVYVVHHIQ